MKGFDGVYLDWVEAYDDEKVMEFADKREIDAADKMIKFIKKIRRKGQKITPDFLVISQNAPYLLDENQSAYLSVIDGQAMEDVWFGGEGDGEWNDPHAGDIPNTYTDDYSTENLIIQLLKYKSLGIPVFTCDYCISITNANNVYQTSASYGFCPIVTRVSLSKLTETPPDNL